MCQKKTTINGQIATLLTFETKQGKIWLKFTRARKHVTQTLFACLYIFASLTISYILTKNYIYLVCYTKSLNDIYIFLFLNFFCSYKLQKSSICCPFVSTTTAVQSSTHLEVRQTNIQMQVSKKIWKHKEFYKYNDKVFTF